MRVARRVLVLSLLSVLPACGPPPAHAQPVRPDRDPSAGSEHRAALRDGVARPGRPAFAGAPAYVGTFAAERDWRGRLAARVANPLLASPARSRSATGAGTRVRRGAATVLATGETIVVGEMWVGSLLQLRAQKLSSAGTLLWGPQGALVCSALYDYSYPSVLDDGTGGALIAWTDTRSAEYDIYAQRLAANGIAQWTADGVAVCSAPFDQQDVELVTDGSGGAILTWMDGREGSGSDIFAQRLSPSGTPQWAANGVAITASAPAEFCPKLVSDGAGGAILGWYGYGGADLDAFAQRIDGAGTPLWNAGGVGVCTNVGAQTDLGLVPVPSGGALIVWADGDADRDIRAQRVSLTGALQWPVAGVVLSAAAVDPAFPVAVADGQGGAIVAWADGRSVGTRPDLYAQRVDGTGVTLWAADGAVVCNAAGLQSGPTLMSDGAGGAFIAWEDGRGVGDIYAQALDGAGASRWTANGVPVCGATDAQLEPAIAPDGAGGAVVSWVDFRSFFDADYYAQRIDGNGAPQWGAADVGALVAPGLQMNAAVCGISGIRTLLAWQEKRNGQYQVRASIVDSTAVHVAPAVTLTSGTGLCHLNPMVTADGMGGGVVAWTAGNGVDSRFEAWMQHVNRDGAIDWTPLGVRVYDDQPQWLGGLVPDGTGGAIAAWSSGGTDVYAQRIDGTGTPRWGPDGAALRSVPGYAVHELSLQTDGAAGAIAAWTDLRLGDEHPYAQRVDSTGAVQWAANGIAICTAANGQRSLATASDGEGGLVAAWSDWRSGPADLYVQRIDADGSAHWTTDGVLVCGASGTQVYPRVVSDGAGGAVATWADYRAVGLIGLYARRVRPDGVAEWTADGVLLGADATAFTYGAATAPDGTGGAVVVWNDWAAGPGAADIHAQNVNNAGVPSWTPTGVSVCTANHDQLSPVATSDGNHGVVIVWEDWRDGMQSVLYEQRLGPGGNGLWTSEGGTATTIALRRALVIGDRVHIEWEVGEPGTAAASVLRRQAQAEEWVPIGTPARDGGGTFTIDDADVQPGGRYAYRLALATPGGEVLSSPVWVDVPVGAAFALELPGPNPVTGVLDVAVHLPRAAGARVELIDVGGRRVLDRRWGTLPAGRSALRLAGTASLPSGLYWVRLSNEGRVRSSKVCFVR